MKVQHTIHIDAPPDLVWAVTVDIDRWPDWTPTVDKAERLDTGPLRVGSRALIAQPGLPEAIWTVTALREGESFAWETTLRGMRMIACHEVKPADAGADNTLTLEARGLVAFLLSPLISGPSRQTIEKENSGLKAFCEAKRSSVQTTTTTV